MNQIYVLQRLQKTREHKGNSLRQNPKLRSTIFCANTSISYIQIINILNGPRSSINAVINALQMF